MEREARKEPKEHQAIDRMKPFNYEQLGTPDDPCFGRFFSLKAKECSKCGDCEICSIVTSQQMQKNALIQEGKGKFKDVEEAELILSQNRRIASMMLKRAQKKDGWCSVDKLIPKCIDIFNLLPTDEEYVRQRIIQTGQETNGLVLNKQLTKYKNA
jgi:hypothetical protein